MLLDENMLFILHLMYLLRRELSRVDNSLYDFSDAKLHNKNTSKPSGLKAEADDSLSEKFKDCCCKSC